MSKRRADTNLTRDNWDEDIQESEKMGVFQQASENELKSRPIRRAKRRVGDGPSVPVFQNFGGFGIKSQSAAAPNFNFLGQAKDSLSSLSKEKSQSMSLFSFGDKKSDSESTSSFKFTPSSNNTSILESNENTVKNGSKDNLMFKYNSSSSPLTSEKKSLEVSLEKKSGIGDSDKGMTSNLNGTPKTIKDNKEYLSSLKSLNMAVVGWIKEHVDKNPFIDLTPIFEDYKKYMNDIKSKNKVCYSAEGKINSGLVADKKGNTGTISTSNSLGFNFGSKSTTTTLNTTGSVTDFLKNSSSKGNVTKPSEKSPQKSLLSSDSGTKDSLANTSPIFSFGKTSTTTSDLSKTESGKPLFSFSSESTKPTTFGGSSSSMFTFGKDSDKPSFGSVSAPTFSFSVKQPEDNPTDQTASEENDEPPKVEVKEVKEDDAIYEKKVKLFYKKDNAWADRGVGTLFLKKVDEKTQLIVRAFNNLGNILLNIVLNESIPCQKQGKNNVFIVCVPNPPIDPNTDANTPIPMLIRVKTSEDTDELLGKLEENKS